MNRKIICSTLLVVTFLLLGACKKYLDEKPSSMLSTISTIDDLQSLMDYFSLVNVNQVGCSDASSDDYYLDQTAYDSNSIYDQNMYTWQDGNIFYPTAIGGGNDWASAYMKIYRANTILENVDKVSGRENTMIKSDVEGQGYFLRGYNFLQLAWAFCKTYNLATAQSDLGLPLRQTTDFNQIIGRSNLKQTYQQILQDLKRSAALLPLKIGTKNPTRPGKAAAYATLARTYLSMRDYTNCLIYADSSLKIKSDLLDYNTRDQGLNSSFQIFEVPEVFYDVSAGAVQLYYGKVDSNLVSSYASGDLRKGIFFLPVGDGTFTFKGSYEPIGFFCGLATDEVYLMRAECYVRTGQIDKALSDLNLLLKYRTATASFVPVSTSNANQILNLVLQERRKELLFRGLRWMDIKRLNMEGAGITLKRIENNKSYILPANSARFAIPLPDDVISLSNLQQNQY